MRMPAFVGRLCFAALLALHSSGCQSGSVASLPVDDTSVAERVQRGDALIADLPSSGDTRQQRLLMAASMYVSAQAYAKAVATLNQVDTNDLARAQRAPFLCDSVTALLGTGDIDGAWATVARPPAGRYAFVDDLDAAGLARVAERRAAVLERRNLPAEAVRERVAASRGLPADARATNEAALWTLLMRGNREMFATLQADESREVQGWATLARIVRDHGDSPAALAGRIDAWLEANAGHPAAARPPAAVARARSASKVDAPAQIGVLLPLHGKLASAGIAVQRGMLAAWQQARADGGDAVTLRFYDSSRSDFAATYDAAVRDGAQLVIGPLEKEHVRLLQQRERLPVPTLALNYPDSDGGAGTLYYYGLAGEDEAAQLARAAAARDLTRAAVIYPAGEWGERLAQQVGDSLRAAGGSVRASASFQGSGDYGEVVRRLLDVGTSEVRHDRLQRLLGTRLAFTPQPRQDIDSLYIIANTLQATQIAPAVQYHHAGNLPVFATSHVNGQPSASAAADLAGIRFVEMPWIADAGQPLRQLVSNAWKDIDDRYLRLYGFGVDAWRLARQLPLFAQAPDTRIDGVTGTLTLDANRRVVRELTWMVYRDGAARVLDDAN